MWYIERMAIITEKLKILIKNGKPRSVVLDIKDYKHLLELAEDKEDLAELKRLKKGGESFTILERYSEKRA